MYKGYIAKKATRGLNLNRIDDAILVVREQNSTSERRIFEAAC